MDKEKLGVLELIVHVISIRIEDNESREMNEILKNEEIFDEVEEDIATIEQIKESILEYKKKYKDEEFNASIVLEYFKEKNKK